MNTVECEMTTVSVYYASNHDLALVNTIFSTDKTGISRTFNAVSNRKRMDYILTRQRDRNLV